MENNKLTKVSLTISLGGIFILLIFSQTQEIKNLSIKETLKRGEGDFVKITGKITRLTETQGLYILNLKDQTGEITVIVFKNKDKISLKENSFVEIEGETKEYENRMEIIANKLKII